MMPSNATTPILQGHHAPSSWINIALVRMGSCSPPSLVFFFPCIHFYLVYSATPTPHNNLLPPAKKIPAKCTDAEDEIAK